MNEFSLIKKYFKTLAKKNKGAFNLSDDIFFDHKKKIAVSIDSYIEGKHFLNFEKPDLVFKKALRSCISDLICKGISPKYYFISFSGDKNNLTKKKMLKIKSALIQEQKRYNIILSGGDTTYSKKLSITISAIGFSNKLPILRNGAMINDDIYLTNNIGDAFIGLNILKNKIKLPKKISDYFIKKFYLPNLPYKFSKKIQLIANSSIDISDGFFQDLNHLLLNSNLSSEISINNIPISKNLNYYLKYKKKKMINYISNGDDYQILFTASKNKRNIVKKISKTTSTKISLIGVITNKSNSKPIKLINGKFKLPKKLGYLHNFE